MANIIDYLKWRGDVPFDADPFNEVDALVLCELVYSPFDGLVPGPGLKEKISIEDYMAKHQNDSNCDELWNYFIRIWKDKQNLTLATLVDDILNREII